MEGAKRNPDKLNTIAIVTVGLTGSALVYLSIIAIQAWYLNESSAVDQVAQFGKQGEVRKSLKAEQVGKITEPRIGVELKPSKLQLYTIPIDVAKDLIIRDAKLDPANLVPAIARSEQPTIQPAFGRPKALPPAPPPVEPGVIDPGAAVPGADQPASVPATGAPAPAAPDPAAPAPAAPAGR